MLFADIYFSTQLFEHSKSLLSQYHSAKTFFHKIEIVNHEHILKCEYNYKNVLTQFLKTVCKKYIQIKKLTVK